jgi:hypothetical protein
MKNSRYFMFMVWYVVSLSIAFPLVLMISLIIGFVIDYLLTDFLIEEIGTVISYCFIGAGIGGGIGLVQWKLFKRKLSVSMKWIFISAIAFALCELVAGLTLWAIGSSRDLDLDSQGLFIYFLIYTVGGALAGLMQINLLKKKVLNPFVWFIASSTGWGIAFLFMLISNIVYLQFPGKESLTIGYVLIFLLIAGMLFGVITGLGMKRMVDQEDPNR